MINIFRNIPDASNLTIPLWLHILILLIFISGIIIIYKLKTTRYVQIILITGLIIHQCILYSWYFLSGYKTLTDGLPLFHCRIAILCLTLFFFTKKKLWAQLGVQIGMLGSIISLVVFVPDPFMFPHITQFTYVGGHTFLGWYAWYILLTQQQLFSHQILLRNNVIILMMNIFLIIIDYLLNANYGFFMILPLFPPPQSLLLRQILLLFIFNLVTYLLGYIFMKFQQKRSL